MRGIVELILREGVLIVGIGLVLGLAGTLALRGVLQSQIYGLGSLDPLVIGIVLTTLAVVAVIACSLPARRAALVNPVSVLNQQ
jgi:putative ABC transport system permease protein